MGRRLCSAMLAQGREQAAELRPTAATPLLGGRADDGHRHGRLGKGGASPQKVGQGGGCGCSADCFVLLLLLELVRTFARTYMIVLARYGEHDRTSPLDRRSIPFLFFSLPLFPCHHRRRTSRPVDGLSSPHTSHSTTLAQTRTRPRTFPRFNHTPNYTYHIQLTQQPSKPAMYSTTFKEMLAKPVAYWHTLPDSVRARLDESCRPGVMRCRRHCLRRALECDHEQPRSACQYQS